MFAVFENDDRECLHCHKAGEEIDDPVFVEDPDATPGVLSLYLKFCSMACAQAWVDAYQAAAAKEAGDE